MNITVKMLLIFSVLPIVLVSHGAAMAGAEGNVSSYAEGAATTAEETRRASRRLCTLIYSDDHRRLVLLRSYLVEYSRGKREQKKLEELKVDNLTHEDISWLCGLLSQEPSQRNITYYRRKTYLEYFLAVVYRTSASPEIKEAVQDAFDLQYYAVVTLKGTTDGSELKRMASLWSSLLGALVRFGSADLLSPLFWEALEAEGFRAGSVLLVHASPNVLARLQGYKDKPVWKRMKLRKKIERLIRDVKIMLEYPALKELSPKYLKLVVRKLPKSLRPERREKLLEQHLKVFKECMERDKQAALESPPQSKTQPPEQSAE